MAHKSGAPIFAYFGTFGKEGAVHGADFSALKEANNYVREQERKAERSIEKEQDIGIDRERGHSL
jgi:hypothetical protein